jgi:thiamine biosynthesis lipoprotein
MRRAGLMLALLLTACRPTGPDADTILRAELAAFGTRVEVSARGIDEQTFGRAVRRIDRLLQDTHRDWHAWKPGRLTDINRAIADGRPIRLAPAEVEIIERARRLERDSLGHFNPAIGALVELWGFHADTRPDGPPPADHAIDALLAAAPSMQDVVITERRLESRNRAVQLDFGGYIKGVAVDRAVGILREAGIEHGIVNAGGDLRAIGRRGPRPWRAAVRHPDGDGGRLLATIDITDGEAVFTSGNYLRYRKDEGIRRGHLLDPRTGFPAGHVASVTVIADTGAHGDAAATAIAVADDRTWPAVAESMGIEHVMRVGADGSVTLTPAMRQRARFDDPIESVVRSVSGGL